MFMSIINFDNFSVERSDGSAAPMATLHTYPQNLGTTFAVEAVLAKTVFA